jgi:hypothetical protein
MASKRAAARFLFCVSAGDYAVSLEPRKVYRALPDAEAEARGMVRVIDESGEDYLYPQRLFVAVDLPRAAADALLASDGAA